MRNHIENLSPGQTVDAPGYKFFFETVLEWLRLLHPQRRLKRILAAFEIPGNTLARFVTEDAAASCEYQHPWMRARSWDDYLRKEAFVEDDSVLCAYLSEFAGLLVLIHPSGIGHEHKPEWVQESRDRSSLSSWNFRGTTLAPQC